MKNKLLNVFVVIICAFLSVFTYNRPIEANAYTLSEAEAVFEVSSGRNLYCHNENARLPMASTTKILTALTVINNCKDLNDVVCVTDKTVGVEGSSVYLKAGDKFTVIDLLYGLMLRSGNDCAETLAVYISGSIDKFVEKMNEEARACGANNSNFKNPHGLPDNDHYTTAEDLVKIAIAAMKNEVFKKIVSSTSYTAMELSEGRKILWTNKNKMLKEYDGANGIKTGYTVKAGRCLVSSAMRNGMEVVCVVLDSPEMFERSKELLDNAFNSFTMTKIIDAEKFDYCLPTDGNERFIKLKIDEDFYYPLKNGETYEVELSLPEKLPISVKNSQTVGDIKIFCKKQLIFSEKIYTLIVE